MKELQIVECIYFWGSVGGWSASMRARTSCWCSGSCRYEQVWRQGRMSAGTVGEGEEAMWRKGPHSLTPCLYVPMGPAAGRQGVGLSCPTLNYPSPRLIPSPRPSLSLLHHPQAQLQGNRALDASDRSVVQGKLSRIAHRLKQLVGA